MTHVYLTPPEAAAELRCRESKILGWIRSGRLPSINLSEGLRPRYRISRAALDTFLAALAVVPESRPVRRQRREKIESFV